MSADTAGHRLASLDLWRMPDGEVVGRIRRIEPDVLNAADEEVDVAGNLRQIADWTFDAAVFFEDEARELEGG